MAGPRQPISLLEAKGKKHLTKNEIEQRKLAEVNASSDNIVAPSYLSKTQKEEFNKIAIELKELNLMTNLDCDLLAQFIVAKGMYIKLTKDIRKFNTSATAVDKPVQFERYEKLIALHDKYFKQCIAVAREFGLTVSSRCKLVAPKKEEPKKNKFDKFSGEMSG